MQSVIWTHHADVCIFVHDDDADFTFLHDILCDVLLVLIHNARNANKKSPESCVQIRDNQEELSIYGHDNIDFMYVDFFYLHKI